MVQFKEDSVYVWFNEQSEKFMRQDGSYLLPGQTLDQRVTQICDAVQKYCGHIVPDIGNRIKENTKKGWYSFSTPVWTNFGTSRGLPISCFNSHIEDNMESILYTAAEIGMMSKLGGGTSAYFGELRPRGSEITGNGKSSGSVHFMQLFNTLINTISQGSTRRGSLAVYLPVDHPDILEFLRIKSDGFEIQDLSFGVCVDNKWLNEMIDGDKKKRKVWAKVLETRNLIGYPYIFFSDNVNDNVVDVYKQKEIKVNSSNLCSEILLGSSAEESFVCCLSSMNLLKYDEWKNTDAVELLVYLLDAVMQEFIDKTDGIRFMERAHKFAKNQRALGLGVQGWHYLLQKRGIAFESMEAKLLNVEAFSLIKEKSYEASSFLASQLGEPELMVGYGRRNATLNAIAPGKSSSEILGQISQCIEPLKSNYYVKDLAKGKISYRNPFLQNLLLEKGHDNEDVWMDILKNRGSVQHLDFLSQEEKDVFKTFEEISPKEVIIQAAQRQKYIDQGQSLNLMIHPKTPTKDVNALILDAWKLGIKTLYYQYSVNSSRELLLTNILECKSCS